MSKCDELKCINILLYFKMFLHMLSVPSAQSVAYVVESDVKECVMGMGHMHHHSSSHVWSPCIHMHTGEGRGRGP